MCPKDCGNETRRQWPGETRIEIMQKMGAGSSRDLSFRGCGERGAMKKKRSPRENQESFSQGKRYDADGGSLSILVYAWKKTDIKRSVKKTLQKGMGVYLREEVNVGGSTGPSVSARRKVEVVIRM